jgi:hypothetical protein
MVLMKNIFLIFLFAGFINCAIAQKIYIQGGVNLANITSNKEGHVEDNKMLTSLNAGIMVGFEFSKLVDIETGLLFTGRGSKAETVFSNGDYVKAKFNPYYIELPLNLVVNFPIDSKTKFFMHAGPYAAAGVGGKSSLEVKVGPLLTTSETDIEYAGEAPFTSNEDDAAYNKLKRMDFGLNLGGGVKLNKIIVKVNYGLGLTKINSTQNDNNADDKNKYRTLSFSVGIPLGN